MASQSVRAKQWRGFFFRRVESEITTDEPCHRRHDRVGRLEDLVVEEHLTVPAKIETA
jgi:hypothetical protein